MRARGGNQAFYAAVLKNALAHAAPTGGVFITSDDAAALQSSPWPWQAVSGGYGPGRSRRGVEAVSERHPARPE